MATQGDKIEVQNINVPGYVTHVNRAKYEAMKAALLRVLPKDPPGLTATQALETLKPHLPEDLFPAGG